MSIDTHPNIFYKTAIEIYEAYFFNSKKNFIINISHANDDKTKLYIFLDLMKDMQNDLSIDIKINVVNECE